MRLREALRDAPAAQRIVIQTNPPPPLAKAFNFPPPLAGEGGVGVLTLPMSDTVKEVVDGIVRRTVPRETVVRVTGPWVSDREALAHALAQVAEAGTHISDMIGLCEAARLRVRVLAAR